MMYDHYSSVGVQLVQVAVLEKKQQLFVCSRHRRMAVQRAAQMLIPPAVNSQLILSST
jgi:hypothetical protein